MELIFCSRLEKKLFVHVIVKMKKKKIRWSAAKFFTETIFKRKISFHCIAYFIYSRAFAQWGYDPSSIFTSKETSFIEDNISKTHFSVTTRFCYVIWKTDQSMDFIILAFHKKRKEALMALYSVIGNYLSSSSEVSKSKNETSHKYEEIGK